MPPDLEDRLILPMLNEAVACLREGIVEDADLLDAGAIFATGFAPFRGGPLQYAKERGVAQRRRARLTELAAALRRALSPGRRLAADCSPDTRRCDPLRGRSLPSLW